MSWMLCAQYLGAGVEIIHVIPLDDLREHQVDIYCYCFPTLDQQEERVIVHNAADGREAFERGERQPS